jgi:hypothetical protein
MIWLRKFGVFLLAIILFAVLLSTAHTTTATYIANSPSTVKGWFAKSGLYNNIVVGVINQNDSGSNSDSVSLQDPQIKAIAQEVFSPQVMQNSFETFIDSNAAWLQGNSKTPNFKIDLSAQKEEFGNKVADKVQSYLTALPVCTPQQVAALQTKNNVAYFSLSCRPSALNPSVEAARAKDQITSSDFLNDPVITASSLNGTDSLTKPYYEKYSSLPSAFQEARFAPIVLLLLSVLLAVAVYFASTTRQKGLKNVAFALIGAFLVLLFQKIFIELSFTNNSIRWFNVDINPELNVSFVKVIHTSAGSFATIDLIIGSVMLLIAIWLLFVAKKKSNSSPSPRPKKVKTPVPKDIDMPEIEEIEVVKQPTIRTNHQPSMQRPKKPRKPRLIQ